MLPFSREIDETDQKIFELTIKRKHNFLARFYKHVVVASRPPKSPPNTC